MIFFILALVFLFLPLLVFAWKLNWHVSWPKLFLYGGKVYVVGCLLFWLLYVPGNSNAWHLAAAFGIPFLAVCGLVVMLSKTQHVWNRR